MSDQPNPAVEWTEGKVFAYFESEDFKGLADAHNAALADAKTLAYAKGAQDQHGEDEQKLAAERGAGLAVAKFAQKMQRDNQQLREQLDAARSEGEREERCEVCNTELSQCGTQGVDGEPSLDCLVCKLREQIAAERELMSTITQRRLDAVRSEHCKLRTIVKTQAIEIKKQKLAIQILVTIIDELRRPYMDGDRHDLYLLGTDGLNQLENLKVLP